MVAASAFKGWCRENISPQSWTRICLRCVELVRTKGFTLDEMEELNPDIDLDEEMMEALNTALYDLYEMTVKEAELVVQ